MSLGASYFRAKGGDSRRFGLSARGLAIDTAHDVEEFPRFVAFWFERPASVEPIDIRLFLRHRGQPLTQTWMYQWTPPPPHEQQAALDLASTQ